MQMGATVFVNNFYLIAKYDKLYIHALRGISNTPIKTISASFSDSFEFSPVIKDVGGDFLAAFQTEPLLEATIHRGYEGDTSIITYSFDKKYSESTIDGILNNSKIIPHMPEGDFIQRFCDTLVYPVDSFNSCKNVSRSNGVSVEKIFGMYYYAYFLMNYVGLSESDSISIVRGKFGMFDF